MHSRSDSLYSRRPLGCRGHRLTIKPSSLTLWRKRMRKKGAERLLAKTISAGRVLIPPLPAQYRPAVTVSPRECETQC